MGRAQRTVKGRDTTLYDALMGAACTSVVDTGCHILVQVHTRGNPKNGLQLNQTSGGYDGVRAGSQTVTSVPGWGVGVDNKGSCMSVGAERTREISAFCSISP